MLSQGDADYFGYLELVNSHEGVETPASVRNRLVDPTSRAVGEQRPS